MRHKKIFIISCIIAFIGAMLYATFANTTKIPVGANGYRCDLFLDDEIPDITVEDDDL